MNERVSTQGSKANLVVQVLSTLSFDGCEFGRHPTPQGETISVWRLAHNSLFHSVWISRRGVDADTRCLVCWRLDEDGGHCFLTCKMVKRCWQSLNLEEARVQLSSLGSAAEVVNNILDIKEEERERWLLICCGDGGRQEIRRMLGTYVVAWWCGFPGLADDNNLSLHNETTNT
jgi:hypothetical protein